MQLKDGLKKYEDLPRDEYFQKNQELSKGLWEKEDVPTVYDIAQFMDDESNEKIQRVFAFFDNEEDFTRMASRTDHTYDQDESSTFIKKVMSANNDEISKAGYFYKLLMASADDFRITAKDCKSEGVLWNIRDITEEIYQYRIKFHWIKEFKGFCRLCWEKFQKWLEAIPQDEIHVRTPLTCNLSENHSICKRCAGSLPDTKNVGTFTTLMVTEHATQSALSSMNKGLKENINDILGVKYFGKNNISDIKKWIAELVDKLENDKVSSRFYEIALLSRVRKDEEGEPFVSSLKASIKHSGNLFGSFIFNSTEQELERIIRKKRFRDNSLKLQIAMNQLK